MDSAAVDVHWGAEKVYDYYDSVHNRNSYNNAGAKILSWVDYCGNYNNAHWAGTYMLFGGGDGITWGPVTSLDIVGHEFTHGVIEYSAGLGTSGESGALNESFSDIFGNVIERRVKQDTSWRIAEDMTFNGMGIRNMKYPKDFNHPNTSVSYTHLRAHETR